jgi:hypothetical protein
VKWKRDVKPRWETQFNPISKSWKRALLERRPALGSSNKFASEEKMITYSLRRRNYFSQSNIRRTSASKKEFECVLYATERTRELCSKVGSKVSVVQEDSNVGSIVSVVQEDSKVRRQSLLCKKKVKWDQESLLCKKKRRAKSQDVVQQYLWHSVSPLRLLEHGSCRYWTPRLASR